MLPPPPPPTLFPYTTLFRSATAATGTRAHEEHEMRFLVHRFVERRRRGVIHRQQHDQQCHRRSEEHTSELQSRFDLVCRLLLEKKKTKHTYNQTTTKEIIQT